MSEPTVFESRLRKLEQDNRRLKLSVGALLLVLAAVPLIGAMMPEQRPQMVRASTFRTIDENGNNRASISADGISYYDENGTIRAWMNDTGFVSFDENGELVWQSSEWQ